MIVMSQQFGGGGGVLLTLSHLSGLSGRLTLMYEEI